MVTRGKLCGKGGLDSKNGHPAEDWGGRRAFKLDRTLNEKLGYFGDERRSHIYGRQMCKYDFGRFRAGVYIRDSVPTRCAGGLAFIGNSLLMTVLRRGLRRLAALKPTSDCALSVTRDKHRGK